MKDDEDLLNINRPEPDENHTGKLSENGIPDQFDKVEPGIKRSLTYHRASKIDNIEKRILYLKKKLKEYRQGIRHSYEFYDEYDFDKCISLEIENLQEEYSHSRENGQYIKVIDNYDRNLIVTIYSLCIDYKVLDYTLPDFIKYIETANFEIKKNKLPHRRFRHLIYFLQTPLGTKWYRSVVKNSGIPVKWIGGLTKELENDPFVKELDKAYADSKKGYYGII